MINISEAITDLSRLQTTFKHLQNLKDILEHAREAEGTVNQANAVRDQVMKEVQQLREQVEVLVTHRNAVIEETELAREEGEKEYHRKMQVLEEELEERSRVAKAAHDERMAEMERDRKVLEDDLIEANRTLEAVRQKVASAEQARARLATMISRAKGAIE
jgi:chromosome segregation ATPase